MKVLCPLCNYESNLDNELIGCEVCGRRFMSEAGVLDFVCSADTEEERNFYDRAYGARDGIIGRRKDVSIVSRAWLAPEAPENRIVLDKVGKLNGKTVLLLGNGESVKELYFLEASPKLLIYSDLSTHALSNIRRTFDLEKYQDKLIFAAIDAHEIPFDDQSVDVIYGYAMVHHLPDLERFFGSVARVLKPGGYAVFMDDAFSPLWHHSKQTWLKPVMKLSHKRTGISPEDYRFSMAGGFRERELAAKIRTAGGVPWFVRTSFLTYLFYRGAEKLLPRKVNVFFRKPRIASVIRGLDRIVCRLPFLARNQIRLVWGFVKPLEAVLPSTQVSEN